MKFNRRELISTLATKAGISTIENPTEYYIERLSEIINQNILAGWTEEKKKQMLSLPAFTARARTTLVTPEQLILRQIQASSVNRKATPETWREHFLEPMAKTFDTTPETLETATIIYNDILNENPQISISELSEQITHSS